MAEEPQNPQPADQANSTPTNTQPASTEPAAAASGAQPTSAPEPAAVPGEPATQPATPAGAVPPPPAAQAPAGAAVPQPPASAPIQPKPVFAKGCVAIAWEDIKASPSWLSRILLLGLISCVPILNFVVIGYLLNWVREVPFGGRTTMPKPIVTGRNFEVGFYGFVIALVFGLVAGMASAVLVWIPILGWVAGIAITLFVEMATYLAMVRMALSKQIGEGFRIAKLWEALKANWGGLFVAAIVPSLLVGLVVMAVFIVLALILAVFVALPASVAASGAAASSAASAAGLLVSLGLGSALLLVAYYLLACMASTFASALAYRAVAHYIGRFAPEWANEARVAMGYPAE